MSKEIIHNKIFLLEDEKTAFINTIKCLKEISADYKLYPQKRTSKGIIEFNFNFFEIAKTDADNAINIEFTREKIIKIICDKILTDSPNILIIDFDLKVFCSGLTAENIIEYLYKNHLEDLKNIFIIINSVKLGEMISFFNKFHTIYNKLKGQVKHNVKNNDELEQHIDIANNWLNSNLGVEYDVYEIDNDLNYCFKNKQNTVKILENEILLVHLNSIETNKTHKAIFILKNNKIYEVNCQKLPEILSNFQNLSRPKKRSSILILEKYFNKIEEKFELKTEYKNPSYINYYNQYLDKIKSSRVIY